MRRILITGVGGFVGQHVLARLVADLGRGATIAGIGRHLPSSVPDGVVLAPLDLLDVDGLAAFVADFAPSHVLHLAALSSVQQAGGLPSETWRVNLLGLLNIAEAIAEKAPKATVLYASSGEVYGRSFLSGQALDESACPRPANVYARTKLAGEGLLGDILPPSARLIVLRPFNHIGPGQDERFVVASFAAQIARIEAGLLPPTLEVGDLSAKRDFLDVADVVTAYSELIRNSDERPARCVFNIASGIARPISELLDGLRAHARVPFDVCVAEDRLRPSEIPTASGDASALSRATGWAPSIAIADALAAILADARARVADLDTTVR